jgi:iron complex outermembrane receptor protein
MTALFGTKLRHHLLVGCATAILATPAMAQDDNVTADEGDDSDVIMVTGSRTVRNGAEMPTPVTVIGEDLITQTGATQLSQVINDLPVVRTDVSATTAFVGGGGNGPGNNLVNLRGLGAVRTLVLVDGLRYPATTFTNLFNTDLIPSSLVSRLDIVTGGASAAYGSDAVAGVVNIQLNHRLEGIRASAQWGVTDVGDAKDQKYSVGFGHRFGDGRVHFIAGVDYQKRGAAGTCYSRQWCAAEDGLMSNSDFATNGLPALIISPDVRASQNTPAGLIVSSQLTSVYGGQQVSDDGRSLLPFTFGQLYRPNNNQMIGGSRPGINPTVSGFNLQGPQERLATYARLQAELADTLEAWVDFGYGDTYTQGTFAQLRSGNMNAAGTARQGPLNTGAITLQRSNPFLPQELVQQMIARNLTTVNIGKSGDGLLTPIVDYDVETFRVATGLKGSLGDWTWDVNYVTGQSNVNNTANNIINQANFTRAVAAVNGTGANAGRIVCAVNQSTTVDAACAPLNLFGVNTASPEALAYAFGTATSDAKIKLDDITINLQGSPFATWAGAVAFATGAEYRRESISAVVDAVSQAGGFVQNYSPLDGRSEVWEGYAEVDIPLLADQPMAQTFDLNGAVRYADYSYESPAAPLPGGTVGPATSGFGAWTWKVGAVYIPVEGLRFRGTYSRDFRAPNLSEQFILPNVQNSAIQDPQTGLSTQVPTQSGGNPNLRPEISYTKTFGITVEPFNQIPNLQVSVDYYDIKVSDYIAAVGGPTLVNQCFQGAQDACAFVDRDAAGNLTFIRNISANANQLQVRGVDLEVGYRHSFEGIGDFDLRVLGTAYTTLTYVNAGSPLSGKCQNGVITQQSYPSMPCYEVSARLNFTTGPVQIGGHLRYIPSGKFGNSYIGPEDEGYSNTLSNSISDNRVSAVTYFDLNANFELIERDDLSFEAFLFIKNLFDTDPPIAPANNIGTNANLYDVLGRSYRVGLRVRY